MCSSLRNSFICFNFSLQTYRAIVFFVHFFNVYFWGFPGGAGGKENVSQAGDMGSILGWEDSLEEEMPTQSNMLAWQIPWTEEPGGLQSMGSPSRTQLDD